jgi:hypothetical protein
LVHNIASGMMLLHISVNFCFFSERQHSEEKRENFELDGSSQSEIQILYFSEYKSRPYCYTALPVRSTQNKYIQNVDSERHTKIKLHNFHYNSPVTSNTNSTWLHVSTSVGHFQVRYTLFWDLTQRILLVTDVSL